MAIAEVTAKVGENEYALNTSTEDTYELDVASPLKTSNVEITAIDEAGNTAIDTSQVLKVIGEWNPPKIDWSGEWSGSSYIGDYFSYIDYNRIKNNLLFLIGYASQMYNVTKYDIGDDKAEADGIYADEVTLLETVLVTINEATYNFENQSKTWSENKNVPSADDWNRIESLQLKIYNTLVAQRKAQNRLAFTLGGQKGFKV